MSHAFICDFVRTPIGRYAGALKDVRTDDLAAHPLRVLRARHPSVDWGAVDDVIFGCANQAGEDNRNVARMAVLLAGLPATVPGSTINRLCGSGLDAWIFPSITSPSLATKMSVALNAESSSENDGRIPAFATRSVDKKSSG